MNRSKWSEIRRVRWFIPMVIMIASVLLIALYFTVVLVLLSSQSVSY